MSSYEEYYGNAFGSGIFHTLIQSEGVDAILYSSFVSNNNENDLLSFGLANGGLFTSYAINVPNTIFKSIKFVLNRGGNCLSFEFVLNRLPEEPILKFTTVQIKLKNKPVFYGYITKRPLDGEEGDLKFSGYGMCHRIQKRTIFNSEKYNITNVQESSGNMILTLSAANLSNISGQKIIVREHIEDKNNGVFDILSNTSNTITVLNPSCVSSSSVTGQVVILPTYWTNSILVSTFLQDTLLNHFTTSPVTLVSNKIQTTTGVFTAGASSFEGMEFQRFQKVIENILKNEYWFGVDGESQFFLKKKPTTKIKTFFEGFDVPVGSITTDEEVEGNAITIFRSGSKSGRRQGAIVAGTASDASSIAKYGESTYSEEIPAWLSNATGQKYAEALLEVMKEPVVKCELKNMPFDFYEFGKYGFVTAPGNWNFELVNFDSLTDFVTGSNISVTLNNQFLVSGSNSHRLQFGTNAINETHVRTNLRFLVSGGKSITFYMRTNKDLKFQFGCGEQWTDHLFTIDLKTNNKFEPIKIDISQSNVRWIYEVGFKILDCQNGTIVYLDYMTINQYSQKHYEFELDEVEYVLDYNEYKCNLKFGDQRKNVGFGEYISGVKAQVELAKLMLRE